MNLTKRGKKQWLGVDTILAITKIGVVRDTHT
jgi:hypothetical protein